MNAALEIDPQSGYTIIVLSNYDPPSAEKVARQIREWVSNLQPSPVAAPAQNAQTAERIHPNIQIR